MSKVGNKLTTTKGLEADIATLSKWSSENGLIFMSYMWKVGNKLTAVKAIEGLILIDCKQKHVIFSSKMSEQ